MISTSEFRRGAKILFKDAPYMVLDYVHVKPGKGGAFVKTKLKNLITGVINEETFRSGEKFPDPGLQYREMQYLYNDGDIYHFMDQNNYEQVELKAIQISEIMEYLKEQEVYTLLYFDERPISAAAPMFMELEVRDTPPGVRGDTAQGGATKPAKLETGVTVQVPLFVQEGEFIKVDTRDGKYIERVKK